MSSTTSRLGLFKPAADGSENVNVVTDLNNNLDKLDSLLGAVECTSSTRPTTRFSGMMIRETDTGKLLLCTNATTPTWVQIYLAGVTLTDNVNVTGSLATSAGVVSSRTSTTDACLTAKTAAASVAQLVIKADGSHAFGSGSGAADVTLSRSNVGELSVSGSLAVGNDISVSDDVTIGGDLAVTGVGAVVTRHKPSDTTRASTTSPTSDPDLITSALPANSVWEVHAWLAWNSPTSADIQLGGSGPSGSTFPNGFQAVGTSATDAFSAIDQGFSNNYYSHARGGTGGDITGQLNGTLFIGATPGAFSIAWAQLSSSTTGTVLRKGSRLRLVRIA